MEKLKIKFHWSFWVFVIFLIYFKEFNLLISTLISLVLHEAGHYCVAKKLGYKLNQVKLMPYGASLSGEDVFIESKHELMIAIAGPITSLIITMIIISLWWIFPQISNITSTFASVNLSLSVVNLLPCYPLDGGRILNSILKKKLSVEKSFKITKIVSGVVIAILTLLYIISCFVKINYSLCLFVIFLTIGLLFNDNVERYVFKSQTFARNSKLKKGVNVNIKAISDKSNLLELYKLLQPSSINYIIILDKMNNTVMTLGDKDIEKILTKYPLDTQLKDIKGISSKKII